MNTRTTFIVALPAILSSERTCESLPDYMTVQGPNVVSISRFLDVFVYMTNDAANCTHFW